MTETLKPTLTPYERMKNFYKDMPKEKDRFAVREMSLSDKTEIVIGMQPYDKMDARISHPKNKEKIFFTIGKENNEVKIRMNDVIMKVGDESFQKEDLYLEYNELASTRERMKKMGEVLVNWLEKVISDGKYSNLPITLSNK
jgi:hypothetical protein